MWTNWLKNLMLSQNMSEISKYHTPDIRSAIIVQFWGVNKELRLMKGRC